MNFGELSVDTWAVVRVKEHTTPGRGGIRKKQEVYVQDQTMSLQHE